MYPDSTWLPKGKLSPPPIWNGLLKKPDIVLYGINWPIKIFYLFRYPCINTTIVVICIYAATMWKIMVVATIQKNRKLTVIFVHVIYKYFSIKINIFPVVCDVRTTCDIRFNGKLIVTVVNVCKVRVTNEILQ